MEINILAKSKNFSNKVFDCGFFTVRCDNYFVDKTNGVHNFFVIEPSTWANIIAITDNQEVLLVKQFRYGKEDFTVEIPGGMVDKGESPEVAAKRELLEETGYRAEKIELIGIADPNPAIQNNRCYMYLATGLKFTGEFHLDTTEEIEVLSVPLKNIPEMIQKGEITHSLVITAFYYYNLLK